MFVAPTPTGSRVGVDCAQTSGATWCDAMRRARDQVEHYLGDMVILWPLTIPLWQVGAGVDLETGLLVPAGDLCDWLSAESRWGDTARNDRAVRPLEDGISGECRSRGLA
jgi:hypothetical protein